MNRAEAIAKARTLVARNEGDRKWLVSGTVACYGNSEYQTEIHVLEGTPARGYVVVVGYMGGGEVHAYGLYFRRKLGKFKFADENHTLKGDCLVWTPKNAGGAR